jgi:thiol-disulfide isomerase/thioredoxin
MHQENAVIGTKVQYWLLLIGLILSSGVLPAEEDSLIGSKPPEWEVTNWVNSKPLQLSDLRGKVILIRWWTAPNCPYCRASAPALNEFYEKYAARGLEVLGFYHHKSTFPLDAKMVKKYAGVFGFKFPIATDVGWKTLHRWWLDNGTRQFTSVSFLIDRKGVIRYIHPGGEYVAGDPDYSSLKENIEMILSE